MPMLRSRTRAYIGYWIQRFMVAGAIAVVKGAEVADLEREIEEATAHLSMDHGASDCLALAWCNCGVT